MPTAAAVRAKTQENLSGAQKGAVLCMALGSERAARILQSLSPRRSSSSRARSPRCRPSPARS